MSLRICLVTPFAWSQPHDVNEHVAGIAAELRGIGHQVTILAPSTRTRDLRQGRRTLQTGSDAEVIAVGPAIPISRRSRIGVPVGARANLSLALAVGRYDIVHGFEPALPSLSYLALRDARALTVATFFDEERLSYPRGKSQRERLLGRIDALIAVTPDVATAARERFPGDYAIMSPGVDTALFRPGPKQARIVLEFRPTERPHARAAIRTLDELPGWQMTLMRTKPLASRPYVPRALVPRVSVVTARDGAARAPILTEAAIFVPAPGGLQRVRLEAEAAGAAIASPPGVSAQPELAAAAMARLAEDDAYREREAARAREAAEGQSFADVAAALDELYAGLARRRRRSRPDGDPLADRDWIVADLHMHTSWSHDCSIEPAELVATRRRRGSARSRSPTTTSSAVRSRPSSSRGTASLIVSPARR